MQLLNSVHVMVAVAVEDYVHVQVFAGWYSLEDAFDPSESPHLQIPSGQDQLSWIPVSSKIKEGLNHHNRKQKEVHD